MFLKLNALMKHVYYEEGMKKDKRNKHSKKKQPKRIERIRKKHVTNDHDMDDELSKDIYLIAEATHVGLY